MKIKRSRKAFTIVELVIVIAVIAVLAAVLIPTFGGVIEKAKDASAMQEARNAYTEYVSKNAAADSEYLIHKGDGRYVALYGGNSVGIYESKREAIWALGAIFESNASAAPNGEKLKICFTGKDKLEGKKISILGDSISTFDGVSDDASYNTTLKNGAIWYEGTKQEIQQEDTWWQQTIDNLGLQLVVNNSWSGSCICETNNGAVKRIHEMGNIHVHLDLIAGLPYEDYKSFASSFDAAYGCCDLLQLGFLKLLYGTRLREEQENYGYKCLPDPPYTVLESKWISYGELQRLSRMAETMERFLESGRFAHTLWYLTPLMESPFRFWEGLTDHIEREDERPLQKISQPDVFRLLMGYCTEQVREIDPARLKEMLCADFSTHEHKNPPAFLRLP